MNFGNPDFWTVILALIALILSQFPPISQILKRTRIKLNVPEQVALFHWIGDLQMSFFLELRNMGGKDVEISKVKTIIKEKDSGRLWRIPARTYYSRQPPPQNQAVPQFFIGTILLKPGETWGETVHFFRVLSRPDEEQGNEISNKIRSDIFEKARELQKQQKTQQWIEADESFVKEAIDYFYQKYDLNHEGNYQLFIGLHSETDKILAVRGFDFTLFKSSIQTMKSATIEDYKYGAGLYYPTTNPAATIWIKISPIEDNNKVQQMYKKIGLD